MMATSVIASGLPEELNSAALSSARPVWPWPERIFCYVADTIGNRIAAIPFARLPAALGGNGHPVSTGGDLNAPLGLATAPTGTCSR